MSFTDDEILAELGPWLWCSNLLAPEHTGRQIHATQSEEDLSDPEVSQLPPRRERPRRIDHIVSR